MSTDKGYLPDSLSLRELASRTRRLALEARSGGRRDGPSTAADGTDRQAAPLEGDKATPTSDRKRG